MTDQKHIYSHSYIYWKFPPREQNIMQTSAEAVFDSNPL